jgi:hypothetical protein
VTHPVAYLAIDPGEKFNGWATFRDTGDLITMGTIIGIDELTDWLEAFAVEWLKGVIVEDYRVGISKGRYGATQHKGARVETVKTIGRIESWAYRNSVPLVLQPNNIKAVAYMWAGITVPKNKNLSHETDAYVHGVYWLQRNGIRRPQQGRRV